MTALFLYGTLRHVPLLTQVLGRTPGPLTRAKLPDFTTFSIEGVNYPAIAPAAGAVAEGDVLTGVTEAELSRLDFFEEEQHFAYERREISVQTEAGAVRCQAYLPTRLPEELGHWSFDEWRASWSDLMVEAATEVMALFEADPKRARRAGFQQVMVRAASRLRARDQSMPRVLRVGANREDVQVHHRQIPYADFFSVEEEDLQFPRFGGGLSGQVRRAAFVGGDAVTVLPYDPQRDRVLLIEQFRFGPHIRGDTCPWVLEPVAGRIDPGETAEEAALRELTEEAGIVAAKLIPIGSYYTSPGAWSEYLYSYIGLCALDDAAGGLGGVAEDEEDIRCHIVGLTDALRLIEQGEADAAPLILSLLWLQRERERLRQGA